MAAVAVIPPATPEEAIDELDFAVGELGLKSIVIYGHTVRRAPSPQVPPIFTFRWKFSNRNGKRSAISRNPGRSNSLRIGYSFCRINFSIGLALRRRASCSAGLQAGMVGPVLA